MIRWVRVHLFVVVVGVVAAALRPSSTALYTSCIVCEISRYYYRLLIDYRGTTRLPGFVSPLQNRPRCREGPQRCRSRTSPQAQTRSGRARGCCRRGCCRRGCWRRRGWCRCCGYYRRHGCCCSRHDCCYCRRGCCCRRRCYCHGLCIVSSHDAGRVREAKKTKTEENIRLGILFWDLGSNRLEYVRVVARQPIVAASARRRTTTH